MIVQLKEIKEHLYIYDTNEDTYLTSLISVAEEAVLQHLNRSSYNEFTATPEPIKHCVKLIVGTLYNNRESVSTERVYKVPHTLEYLLQFYIKY